MCVGTASSASSLIAFTSASSESCGFSSQLSIVVFAALTSPLPPLVGCAVNSGDLGKPEAPKPTNLRILHTATKRAVSSALQRAAEEARA
eukprot:CAMPEP_0185835750 /NCGR_PEP_ID=MMETSP1353-20130828/8397_1 /TAXON_ID=1077150 /ORGANISM="Erythrolobus australicus, Strain CCMP3124" /LENGTH=89 /DNA_ID=CAMNT_0028534431 /DNA_START=188 /DNA_END=458 /DNA_ORIENTATION=+